MQSIINSNKKLKLYFDINRTILLADSTSKNNFDDFILALCCEFSWGELQKTDEKSTLNWKLKHNEFCLVSPNKDYINYKDYVERCLLLKTIQEEVDDQARNEFNNNIKLKRLKLFREFFNNDGPGIELKKQYEKLINCLTLPKSVLDEFKLNAFEKDVDSYKKEELCGDDIDRERIRMIFSDGKYQILPAFFNMIISLLNEEKDFTIIFRTFRGDLKKIISEFNLFCEGKHPCFNGKNNFSLPKFDGFEKTKKYVIDNNQTGLIYRNSINIDQTSLILGTLNRLGPCKKRLEDLYKSEIKENKVRIYHGADQIYQVFMGSFDNKGGYALQDDYDFWNKNGETVYYAKPMLIDPTDHYTLHIFFDDSITGDQNSIVDVRNVINKQSIEPSESMNRYLVRCDIFQAINDLDYFVKLIQACEKNAEF